MVEARVPEAVLRRRGRFVFWFSVLFAMALLWPALRLDPLLAVAILAGLGGYGIWLDRRITKGVFIVVRDDVIEIGSGFRKTHVQWEMIDQFMQVDGDLFLNLVDGGRIALPNDRELRSAHLAIAHRVRNNLDQWGI